MRRFLFDKQGNACYYLTGAGVLFDAMNQVLGRVQREVGMVQADVLEPVVGLQGQLVAWFDDAFLWSVEGELLAFVKGAKPQEGFVLPKTQKLAFTPEPQAVPFRPLLFRWAQPERKWQWASQTLVLNNQEFYT